MNKKILMVLAVENFRDIEYIVPKAFFEQANVETKTISSKPKSVGRFGFEVKNDFVFGESSLEDFKDIDGIFLVGGLGVLKLGAYVDTLVRNLEKPVGAICAAPRKLLEWGLLKGKNATGNDWDNNFASLCEEYGANYVDQGVVIDGNILTASGPEVAEEAALEFLKLL